MLLSWEVICFGQGNGVYYVLVICFLWVIGEGKVLDIWLYVFEFLCQLIVYQCFLRCDLKWGQFFMYDCEGIFYLVFGVFCL